MGYDFIDEKPPRRLSLKAAIAQAGLTQRELSDIIDRHELIVSQIVVGRINPTKYEAYRIAAALHVHPRALFGDSLFDWSDWISYADKFKIDYEMPPLRRAGE
jgi:hypothetical protein